MANAEAYIEHNLGRDLDINVIKGDGILFCQTYSISASSAISQNVRSSICSFIIIWIVSSSSRCVARQ